MSNSLKEQYASTPLFGGNASAVEALYEQYLSDASPCRPRGATISSHWVRMRPKSCIPRSGTSCCEGASSRRKVRDSDGGNGRHSIRRKAGGRFSSDSGLQSARPPDRRYRSAGTDGASVPGVLKLDYLGLTDADMDTEFYTGGLAGMDNERMKLRDILDPVEIHLLRQDRCGVRTYVARA